MKRFFTMSALCLSMLAVTGQDTTSNRMIILDVGPSNITFLKDDNSVLTSVLPSGMDQSFSTGHGLFINPLDRRLYAMLDPLNYTSRAIYQVNPLTGTKTLSYDPQEQFASVEVTDSGRVFAITGNGGSTPGDIYELNLAAQTKTFRYNADVPMFEPRALGFYPSTQQLRVYSSYLDTVYAATLNSWNETSFYNDMLSEEAHGVFVRNDTTWLATYFGVILRIDPGSSTAQVDFQYANSAMDLTEVVFIDTTGVLEICPGDSVAIPAIYSSSAYQWYRNDTAIPGATSQTHYATQAGNYRLLSRISNTSNYIWSEIIEVTELNAPLVNVTTSDSLICPGDSIVITGSSGGTSQWYMNGTPISGETGSAYTATAPGVYNMMKTNQNGCSDSADVPVVIIPDPDCFSGITESPDAFVHVYPNPAGNFVHISSSASMHQAVIFDITGRELKRTVLDGKEGNINLEKLSAGTYILQIINDAGTSTLYLSKQ